MIEALSVFALYFVFSIITMAVFWGLQIRFGSVADLDPDNFFVRWISKAKKNQSSDYVIFGPIVDKTVASDEPVYSGALKDEEEIGFRIDIPETWDRTARPRMEISHEAY